MIPSENFQFLKSMGKNGNGPIYLARNRKNTTNVVIKIIPTFFIERRISSIASKFTKIRHPALAPIHGIIEPEQDTPTIYRFVSDFFENGSLADIYKRFPFIKESQFWNPTRKSIIAFGIAAAMQYLHYKGVTHQFLTPYKILFDKFLQPHVTDYWISSYLPKGSQQNSSFGLSSIYAAPECLQISNLTNSVDVFSYGIILYELAFENPLYDSDSVTLQDILKDLTSKSYMNSMLSNKLCNLILSCIQLDPQKRPSFDLIVASFYDDLEPLFLNTNAYFLSQYRLSVIKTIVHEMSKISLFEYGNDQMNRENLESMCSFVQSSQYNIKPLFKYGEMAKNYNVVKFAADKGNKSAQFSYSLHIAKDNPEESLKYLKMSADQNYRKAIERLITIDEDNEYYLKKAADLGSTKAQIKYALKSGKLYYLKMAAKNRDSEALYLLAVREENGPPIQFIDIQGYKNILATYEKNNPSEPQKVVPKPQDFISPIDFDNEHTGYPFDFQFFQDQEKAYNIISSISEKVIYKDLNSAIKHYNQAVALNNSEAINRLGEIGKNGQKMISKYQIIFTQNDQKKIDELIMYSIMLLKGSFNVERNIPQAIQILKYAAKNSSNPDAQFVLFKLMKNDYLKFNNFSTIENLDSEIEDYNNNENNNKEDDYNSNNFYGNENSTTANLTNASMNYSNLKNDIEALMYLKNAAYQGHIHACLYYAQHLFTKNNVQGKPFLSSPSLEFYRQAANLGNLKAILTYSSLVQSFYNPNFNYNYNANYNNFKYSSSESIVYCRIAADRGSPHAQITYGKYLENKRINIDHPHYKSRLIKANKIAIDGAENENENEEEEEEGQDENDVEEEEFNDTNNNNFMNSFLQLRQKNLDQALFYFKLAAKQGFTEAMLAIAQLYEKEKNMPFCHMKISERDVTKKYLIAGSCGDPYAMYNAGQRFAQGIGVPQDPNQAIVYFRIASFMGYISAQYKYGHYLAFSPKTKKSQAIKESNEGLKFLMLAVSQGYNMSLLLGIFNEFDSINMNDQNSIQNIVSLFKNNVNFFDNYLIEKIRAIDSNNNNNNNSNDNNNNGKDRLHNIPDFKSNYRMKDWVATYSTYLFASQSIGLLYRNGLLSEKPDLNEAMFWLDDSANLGSSDTYLYIGEIYESRKEYLKAFEKYQQGNHEGVLNCTLKLAHCYEKGIGCQKDIEAAAELYESIGIDNLSYYLNAAKLYDRMYQQLSQDAKRNRIKQRTEMKSNVIRLLNSIRGINNNNNNNAYDYGFDYLIGNFDDDDYEEEDNENEMIQNQEKEILKRIYSLYSKAVVLDDPIYTAHYRMGQILLSDTLTKISSKNSDDPNNNNNNNNNDLDDVNDDFPSFLLSSFNKKEFGITFLQEAVNNGNTDAMIEMASFIKSVGRINLRKNRLNSNESEPIEDHSEDDNVDIFFCGNRINHSIIYINYYSDEQKFEFMHNLIIKASRRGNIHANVIYASALINSFKNHINDKLWMKMVGKGFKIIKKILDKYQNTNAKLTNPYDDFYTNFLSSFDYASNRNDGSNEKSLNCTTKNGLNIDDEKVKALDDAVSEAYVLLSKLYEDGNAVIKSPSRAMSLCISASQLGHQTAILKANRIAKNEAQSIKNMDEIQDEILIELKRLLDEMLFDLNKEIFTRNLQKIEALAIRKNCWQAQFVLGRFYNGNEYIERDAKKVLCYFRMAANNIISNRIQSDLIFNRSDVFVGLSNVLIEKNMIHSALFYLNKAIEIDGDNKEAVRKKINLILNNYSAKSNNTNNEASFYESSTFTPSIEDIDHFYSSMRNRFVCKSKKALPTAKINELSDLSSSLGFLKNDEDCDNNANDLSLIKQKEILLGRDVFLSSFDMSKPCIDMIYNSYSKQELVTDFNAKHNVAYILSHGLKSNNKPVAVLDYLREAADAETPSFDDNSNSNSNSSATNSKTLFYKYNYDEQDDFSQYMRIRDEKKEYEAGGYAQYHYAKYLINASEGSDESSAKSSSNGNNNDNNNNNNNDDDDDARDDVATRFIADHYLEQAASKGNIEAIRLLSSLKVDSNPTMSSHYGKLGSDLGDRLSMTRRACDLIFGSVLIGYRVSYTSDKKEKKEPSKQTENEEETSASNANKSDKEGAETGKKKHKSAFNDDDDSKCESPHEVPISFVGKSFMRESRSLLEVVARTSGRASFVLGALYECGELLKKNYKKAFEYYSASSALGFRESLLRIAVILAFGGHGLERDERRSLLYAKKAAFFKVPLAVKAKMEGKMNKLGQSYIEFMASLLEKSLSFSRIPKDEEEDSKPMKVFIEDNKNLGKVIKATKEQENEDDKKGFKLRRNERCIAMSDLFKYCFGQNGIIYGICEDDCEYDHEYEYEYLYDYDYEYEYEDDDQK